MAELLRPMVASRGDEVALRDDLGSSTWRQLDERVDRWIGALRGAGLRTGDRVAFVLGNRRETFEALLACIHTGIVAVPVNWRLTAPEIGYILDDAGSRGVLTESRYADTVAAALELSSAPVVLHTVVDRDDLPAAGPADEACSGAVLLYTSGTSGRPKGVVNPLLRAGAPIGAVAATAAGVGAALGIPEQGRALLVGPWYHSAQLFFSVFPLLRGCTLVMRRKFDAAEVVDLIDRERISIGHLVPTQLIRLLRLPAGCREGLRGDSLARIWHGGGPCPPDVKRAMIDWWGPVLYEYYAATEAGIATVIDSTAWLKKPGSVGRPMPPTEIVITGPDGSPLPAGQQGAVCVRRPPERGFHYHGAPEKTAAAYVAPGTFTVGDVGYVDEDGFLFLTGRSVEIIVSGGVNIYPAEVEGVLLAHPVVRDAVVFGVPDEEFGEQVKALVEVEPGTGVDAGALPALLDAHCRAQLAGFKVPRSYDVVAELPREPTGKVAKQALREPYWHAAGRRI